jgi:hypothetical protein
MSGRYACRNRRSAETFAVEALGLKFAATYRLQRVAKTSDGQSLSLWTHLTCQAPA